MMEVVEGESKGRRREEDGYQEEDESQQRDCMVSEFTEKDDIRNEKPVTAPWRAERE